jgi:hypothetical protein
MEEGNPADRLTNENGPFFNQQKAWQTKSFQPEWMRDK